MYNTELKETYSQILKNDVEQLDNQTAPLVDIDYDAFSAPKFDWNLSAVEKALMIEFAEVSSNFANQQFEVNTGSSEDSAEEDDLTEKEVKKAKSEKKAKKDTKKQAHKIKK